MALTVGELITLLQSLPDPNQKVVFTESYYGDFDVVGLVGSCLSEDNFEKDWRPLVRMEARNKEDRVEHGSYPPVRRSFLPPRDGV